MAFKDLLKKNRSYRGYDESYTFTKEQLAEFVDHARYANSSMNAQPLCYYLAWEKETVDKIQPLTRWGGSLPNHNLPYEGKKPTAFIIICQDIEKFKNVNQFQVDVGIVAEAILLAATEAEYGGIMIGSASPEKVIETLSLPANIRPMLVLALGKPNEEIVLTEVGEDKDIHYYRDEQDVHYVPKRSLEDIIIN
jgi:Nitroreductase